MDWHAIKINQSSLYIVPMKTDLIVYVSIFDIFLTLSFNLSPLTIFLFFFYCDRKSWGHYMPEYHLNEQSSC